MRVSRGSRQAAGLALELSTAVPATSRNPRVHIVSPSLCQDVLQRLAPTLPTHHGCDLIDVNPGACLWSRELHNALKPRRHILVEPDRDVYDKFISPLVRDRREVFHYADELKDVFDKERRILSENVLQQENDSLTRQNTSLVMTINLTGKLASGNKFRGQTAQQFFHDLFTSMGGLGSNLFRYGLIRVLAWVPDDAKFAILPRSCSQRTKQSFQFDAFAHVQEVAGAPWNQDPDVPTQLRRWYDVETETDLAVKVAEEEAGMKTPADRQDLPPLQQLLALSDMSPENLRTAKYYSDTSSIQDFLDLDNRLRETCPEWYQNVALQPKNTRKKGTLETAEQKLWRTNVTRLKTRHHRFMATAKLIENQRQLEEHWRSTLIEGSVDDTQDNNLKARARRLRTAFSKESVDNQKLSKKAVDDYRTWDATPKAMNWNLRTMNPVVVRPDEFIPQRPIALLDITPKSQYREVLDTDSKRICFEYFMVKLSNFRAKTVREALADIVGGDVNKFIKTVPSLQDVIKGGWYDLDNLRVRSLSSELMFDIGLAYEQWPFRVSTQKMVADLTGEAATWVDN